MLYIKDEGYISPEVVTELVNDGYISWIKYAIVREQTSDDDYLKSLTESVDPNMIVSGIGEQPAIIHLKDFGLMGYTSGCVCVAPSKSMQMLQAIKSGDFARAEDSGLSLRVLRILEINMDRLPSCITPLPSPV